MVPMATLEDALRLHEHPAGTLTGLDCYLHQHTGGMTGSLSPPHPRSRDRGTPRRKREDHPDAARCRRPRPRCPGTLCPATACGGWHAPTTCAPATCAAISASPAVRE